MANGCMSFLHASSCLVLHSKVSVTFTPDCARSFVKYEPLVDVSGVIVHDPKSVLSTSPFLSLGQSFSSCHLRLQLELLSVR
jgi:hypothetical protein